ncbi:MAG: hypothetical protein K9N46_15955 [Candidatus Marinimicrobia bacterium]|nr:hypothetical protein [Candidatus Neomarinimicrobiota bacterium]MCF7830148.1 hypothetical protein [Candidatus Neomarinimicrobiota bacterium]MCF7882225.1 hypothetical protein [Candidatus Neomarinimicrobiota bacterium]
MSELEKLIELQQVDKELMRIEELKGDLPEKVRETRQALRKHEAQLEEDKGRLEEIKKEERKHQATIDDKSEKVEEKQDQLYLVTTNKEYDALTSEIEQFKKSVDEAEMQLVELSDEKEQLEEAIAMEENQVEELAEDLEKRESDLEKTIKKTEEEQEKLEKEREGIVKDIPRSKLSRYDRIRNARNGLAVVPVVRGSCGGCLQRIPPQNLVEIRTKDRMMPCEICGRFLYWPEEQDEGKDE